jgi:Co/Zn/Cd efflux system component
MQSLLTVTFLGFLVNCVGVIFFHDYSRTRCEQRQAAHDENMSTIFQHLSVDALGSVGVMLAIWMTSRYICECNFLLPRL